jgi:S-adenosylmethionine uptake transporter
MLLGAHERGGWLMAMVVVLGVTGTAILLGPQLAVGSIFGLWALVGAAASAVAHITVRALSTRNPPETVVFWFQLGAVVLAVTLLLATTGTVPLPPAHLWAHLLGCGAAATVGQVLMTRAYAADPAPVVAAASYVAPLWGLAGDLLLFAHYPAAPALLGGGLIVLAGMLLLSSKPAASEAPESAKG